MAPAALPSARGTRRSPRFPSQNNAAPPEVQAGQSTPVLPPTPPAAAPAPKARRNKKAMPHADGDATTKQTEIIPSIVPQASPAPSLLLTPSLSNYDWAQGFAQDENSIPNWRSQAPQQDDSEWESEEIDLDAAEPVSVASTQPPVTPVKPPPKRRGRPRKPQNVPPPVNLPFPAESPRKHAEVVLKCSKGGVSKTVKITSRETWADGRVKCLDAMNIAPLDRPITRIGFRFNDAGAKEDPTAIDTVEEWDDMLKDVRMNVNERTTDPKVKSKLPITITDITTAGVDKTTTPAGGRGRGAGASSTTGARAARTNPSTQASDALDAPSGKFYSHRDSMTMVRATQRCDKHDRYCKVYPAVPGREAEHREWDFAGLTAFAKKVSLGLTPADRVPPELLIREEDLGPQVREPLHPQPLRKQATPNPAPPAPRPSEQAPLPQPTPPEPAATPFMDENPLIFPLTSAFLAELDAKFTGEEAMNFCRFTSGLVDIHGLRRLHHLVDAGVSSLTGQFLVDLQIPGLNIGIANILFANAKRRVTAIRNST